MNREPTETRPLLDLPELEIGECIGRGGTAEVFAARRVADGCPVALKVVRPAVAKVLGVERFLREIHIAASLRHPRLVPLESWGEVGGVPYYVMPLLSGGSLRERIAGGGPLGIEDTRRVAIELAEALAALHAAGIVHRDVKPENVLFDAADGSIRLADYGLARAITVSAVEPLTSTGIILGTPAYMSPEQGAGDPVDARADVYSWGCVVYETLAGEPPFIGASAQALIGRHLNQAPPAPSAARSTVPPGLDAAVLRALAKSPADRFQSADELRAALDHMDEAPPAPGLAGRRRWWMAGVVAALVAGAFLVRGIMTDRPAPDPNRVVVFPFDGPSGASDEGERLAILIGSALERSEPLRWLDGWTMLDSTARSAGARTVAEEARLSRSAGARYFLDGSIVRTGDTSRVVVRLHDVTEPNAVLRRTASGTGEASSLALEAVIGVLPTIVGVDRVADVRAVGEHPPAAVAKWLQGEREYRAGRMSRALALFEEAVAEDSLLAPAALRGALAANWVRPERAGRLIDVALRHPEQLTARQRPLAKAVQSYLSGAANQAIADLRDVFAADSGSVEGWMVDGEVHLHLLPTTALDSNRLRTVPPPVVWPLERLADEAFAQALSRDSTFLPPATHAAEIALRAGRLAEATRHLNRLRAAGVDRATLTRLGLSVRCVQDGAGAVDWRAEVRRDLSAVYQVGAALFAAPARARRACAESSFAAVLGADTAATEKWLSLVGLHGLMVARGDTAGALRLVDSATATLPSAVGLFPLDEAVGIETGGRGTAFVAQLGHDYAARGTPSLWLLTIWYAARSDAEALRQIEAVLAARARAHGDRLDRLIAAAAGAHLALARGDTTTALDRFRALEPSAPPPLLESSLWESLAVERLALARLLLTRGAYAEAHRVAATFDQPRIFIHPLMLGASLAIRVEAARKLGDSALEAAARARLADLRGEATPTT